MAWTVLVCPTCKRPVIPPADAVLAAARGEDVDLRCSEHGGICRLGGGS